MSDSLLPDNRSPLQAAIEKAVDQVLADREAQFPASLFDAMTVPRQFLVARAIETGVADWSPPDSEQMQRMTTRDAIALHRLSCTSAGIRQSLQALGYDAGVYRVRPYVLAVEAEIESAPLTPELHRRVLNRVATYKAGRDSIELAFARSAEAESYIGTVTECAKVIDVQAWTETNHEVEFEPLHLGLMCETYIISEAVNG
ncbi:phage tail protein [Aeromonas salmonicida]|uniref:phage tail protein n=1 Tax=Aeromonas salmonicida TaxID=645 RepID=UPI0031D37657